MAGATQPARLAQNGPLRFVCFINTSHAGNNTLVNINWQSCPKRRTGYGLRGGPVRDGEGIALAPIGDAAAVPRGCFAAVLRPHEVPVAQCSGREGRLKGEL